LTVTTFRDLGVNSAVTRYIAKYRAEGKPQEIKNVLATGVLADLLLSAILSLSVFLLAGFIANDLFHRPSIKYLIEIASLTVFGQSLLTVSQSAFSGFERMGVNGIIKILNTSLKTILEVLLVLFGFGVLGAIMGQTLALITSGVVGTSLVFVLLYRSLKLADGRIDFSGTLKIMLKYSLPIYFATLLTAVISQFTDIMTAIYCNDQAIGNYKVTLSFAQIIGFFTIPLSTVLFPAFSKIGRDETGNLQTMFRLAVKYTALVTIPVSMAVIVLSTPLTSSLYGSSYEQAPLFLSIICLGYINTGFGNIVIASFINGHGETWVNTKLVLAILVVNIPLGLLLIPRFGILGVIALTIIAQTQSLILGLWWIKKAYGMTVEWNSSLRICLASALTAFITCITLSHLPFYGWIHLILGGSIFLTVLLFLMPMVGAVNKRDLSNLKEMLSGIGFVHIPLSLLLGIMERVMSMRDVAITRSAMQR
jgi:O-antigen/teichoic acid export membrane protein